MASLGWWAGRVEWGPLAVPDHGTPGLVISLCRPGAHLAAELGAALTPRGAPHLLRVVPTTTTGCFLPIPPYLPRLVSLQVKMSSEKYNGLPVPIITFPGIILLFVCIFPSLFCWSFFFGNSFHRKLTILK